MRSDTLKKLAVLTMLYLAQGLPYGFFTQALPVVLRERGYSLKAVGLSSALALPWALKFLWASKLEWPGARRFIILPTQALLALLLCAMATIPIGAADGEGASLQLAVIMGGVLLINLVAATQDIGTDGLALDILSPKERGLGNGVQVAGYRLGMIIGGGALLLVYGRYGWAVAFISMAGLIALCSTSLLRFKEPPQAPTLKEAPKLLARPAAARVLIAVMLFKVGPHLSQAMLRPFLVDVGLSLENIGVLIGALGFSLGLLGALLGGALLSKISRAKALWWFGLLQALSLLPLVFLTPSTGMGALALVIGLEHLASGMATAALFTWMMDQSSDAHRASDYTLLASAVVVASGVAAALSGFSASALGYRQHFLAASAVALLAAFVMRVAAKEPNHA